MAPTPWTEANNATPTKTARDILSQAQLMSTDLGFTVCDPAHVLLALTELPDEYSIHQPLQRLGLEFKALKKQLKRYAKSGEFDVRNLEQPHLQNAINHASSVTKERDLVNTGALAFGVFTSPSPMVEALLRANDIDPASALATLEEPNNFVPNLVPAT